MKVDFSGYATKSNVKCSDGRVIDNAAFEHMDGKSVPLVWQHLHNDPGNVIGRTFLEKRANGIYCYASLNNTSKANDTRELLRHGDLDSMSIYANHVQQRGSTVVHGDIVEVSLVLRGANPGAKIEQVTLSHGDGTYDDLEDEIVVHAIGEVDNFGTEPLVIDIFDDNGKPVQNPDDVTDNLSHADEDTGDDNETIGDIFNTLTDKQKTAVYAVIGQAVEEATKGQPPAKETPKEAEPTVKQSDEGDGTMKFNAFENPANNSTGIVTEEGKTLSHADIEAIATATFDDCRKNKTNFKDALMHAADSYGITNIDILFPDAVNVNKTPEFVKRRTEWVSTVMNGTKHTPFSRIRSTFADITADEARARGYIKGKKKLEEVFPVMKRTTTPQTIYKKQKLDRDDMIDITDFDVVAWLRAEMRIMLDEEIARAILIGDGRAVDSDDKIKEENIRPIWTDDDFYSYKLQIPSTKANDYDELADTFIRSRLHYEGAGTPVAFMAPETVTELMLQRDKDGNRKYKTETELRDALRVTKIVEVPLFYGKTRTASVTPEGGGAATTKTFALNAIIVNLSDYTVGADKGGQVTTFDDFDIDFNQYKYLIETRISGALTGYHSAVVIETEQASTASASKMAAPATK